MKNKINSEFKFTRKLSEEMTIELTLYVNYEDRTYDFMQKNQEGIFPNSNNTNTSVNRAYLELGLEVIDFVENDLFETEKDVSPGPDPAFDGLHPTQEVKWRGRQFWVTEDDGGDTIVVQDNSKWQAKRSEVTPVEG